ncbi:DUF481 domain-containing protein [Rheinheimera sp.]|uniref:DUF481 domain-containing protein n=1 Tax=Rheinheimera sp. TaxID=1869214 RepID=UPI00307F2D30
MWRQGMMLGLVLYPLPLLAAEIRIELTNGDKLSGHLVRLTATELILKTSYAGELQIKHSHIRSTDPALTLPEQADAAEVAAKPDSKAEPATAVLHQHQVDFTASTRRNEHSLDHLGLHTSSELRWSALRANLDAAYDYETSDNLKKTHKYNLNPDLDYFFSPGLFWRAKADYSYNYLVEDYKNVDVSAGAGYSFMDNTQARAELIFLLGLKFSEFRQQPLLELLLGGDRSVRLNFSQLEWDLRYRWSHSALEWYSDGHYMYNLNQPIPLLYFDGEVKANTGLRYYLTDSVSLSYSWSLEWSRIDLRLPEMPEQRLNSRDLSQKVSLGAKF